MLCNVLLVLIMPIPASRHGMCSIFPTLSGRSSCPSEDDLSTFNGSSSVNLHEKFAM